MWVSEGIRKQHAPSLLTGENGIPSTIKKRANISKQAPPSAYAHIEKSHCISPCVLKPSSSLSSHLHTTSQVLVEYKIFFLGRRECDSDFRTFQWLANDGFALFFFFYRFFLFFIFSAGIKARVFFLNFPLLSAIFRWQTPCPSLVVRWGYRRDGRRDDRHTRSKIRTEIGRDISFVNASCHTMAQSQPIQKFKSSLF